LLSIRQLAVQASNAGVNDTQNLSADQAQIKSAIQSINRISANTQFGTKFLLNGNAQTAATTTAGSATATGSGATIVSQGRWTSGNAYNYSSVSVQSATASQGVASLSTTGDLTTSGTVYGGNVKINGTTYSLAGTESLAQLNTAIQSSGYTATVTGANKDQLTFVSSTTGVPASAQSIDTSGLTGDIGGGGSPTTFGAATVTQGAAASLKLDDGSGHTLVSSATVAGTGGNNTYVFGNGLVVSASASAGAVAGAAINATAGTTSTGSDLQFQIGANGGQTTSIAIQSTAADQLGQGAASYKDASGTTQQVYTDSVADIDVTSFKGAQDAIAVIDKAIADTSKVRASLGAFQTNVLQSNASSLSTASQNVTSSKSSITDADLAATVVSYTKDQILVQSSTTALSYANQMPQAILKLLQ
jgi:flagellin